MFRQALFIISTCNLKGVGHLMSFMCMIYTFSLPFGMVYIIRFYITYKIYSKYIVDGVLLCSIFSYVNTTYYYVLCCRVESCSSPLKKMILPGAHRVDQLS